MLKHAKAMRRLTELAGGPTVLVACHPIKHATGDNLLPRGGGAFIAEIDGNLVAAKQGNVVSLHWQGKFRGPDFASLSFQLQAATHPALVDSKGRPIRTVTASYLTDEQEAEINQQIHGDRQELLAAIRDDGEQSLSDLAHRLEWHRSKVQRTVNALIREKVIKREGGNLVVVGKVKKSRQAPNEPDTVASLN